jgi:hypothetical protein
MIQCNFELQRHDGVLSTSDVPVGVLVVLPVVASIVVISFVHAAGCLASPLA